MGSVSARRSPPHRGRPAEGRLPCLRRPRHRRRSTPEGVIASARAVRAPASAAARASPASGGPAVRPVSLPASRGRAVGGGRGRPVEHGRMVPPAARRPPRAAAAAAARSARAIEGASAPTARECGTEGASTWDRITPEFPRAPDRAAWPIVSATPAHRGRRRLRIRRRLPTRRRRQRAACGGGSSPCRRPAPERRSENRSRRESPPEPARRAPWPGRAGGVEASVSPKPQVSIGPGPRPRRRGFPGFRAPQHATMDRCVEPRWVRW